MKITKIGHQSKADAREFVMSTALVDRVGDIVEQDWDLADFRENPIALWHHDVREPIGKWHNVRVLDGELRGYLDIAEEGTSETVDKARSLIDQRILRAVSVGFNFTKAVPIDPKKPFRGYRLSGNSLYECSLVSIPINYDALSLSKSLSFSKSITSAREAIVRKAAGEARARRAQLSRLRAR